MENINFTPEYILYMKEALKEVFYIEEVKEKEIPDSTELLNFLLN